MAYKVQKHATQNATQNSRRRSSPQSYGVVILARYLPTLISAAYAQAILGARVNTTRSRSAACRLLEYLPARQPWRSDGVPLLLQPCQSFAIWLLRLNHSVSGVHQGLTGVGAWCLAVICWESATPSSPKMGRVGGGMLMQGWAIICLLRGGFVGGKFPLG